MRSIPMYVSVVEVIGTGRFPLDMLQVDTCLPRGLDDVAKMAESFTGQDRQARQITLLRYSHDKHSVPNVKRWKTLLWSVVSVRDIAGRVLL